MVFELLGIGAKNARSAQELATIIGTERRGISLLVERERREGMPICATCDSSNPGYYIPESRTEMEHYCNRLRHRAGEIFKTRAACMKSMDKLPIKE